MFRLGVSLCLLLATPLGVAAPLTFEDALSQAVRSSPDIAAKSAAVDSARSASHGAGVLPDPKLTFGVENLPVGGADRWSIDQDFMTMRKVGIMQEVPNSALRAARRDEASAAIDQAEAERRVLVLSVRRDAALAWLQCYYLDRQSALLDELDHENQLFDQSVQARFAAGSGNPADLLTPKQEAADLADRRDVLASEISQARSELKRWVGGQVDEMVSGQPPELAFDTELLRVHVHEHPDLAVFVPKMQQAQAQVHEAQAAKRPDWGVELSYGKRGPEFGDLVSLQFTLGLPIFGRTHQDPQIAAHRADLAQVESEREAMLRDHTQELEATLAEHEVHTRQLARLREVHLPLAQQKVDYQFASYRAGKVDLSAVLAARRELIEARLAEIELDAKREADVARLYFFYGPGASAPTDVVSGEGAP